MSALHEAMQALENARRARDEMPHGTARSATNTALDALDVAISKAMMAQPQAPSVPADFEWPKPPLRRGQSPVLFDDGYEEGWAKCVATIHAMLATAPVGLDANAAVPDLSALCDAAWKVTTNYLEEYEFDDGESGHTHKPSEFESLLILDAIAGLTGDYEWLAAMDAWRLAVHGSAPQAQATPLAPDLQPVEPTK